MKQINYKTPLILLLVGLLFGVQNVIAQECASIIPKDQVELFSAYEQSMQQKKHSFDKNVVTTLKLQVHIIRDNNGNGGLTQSELNTSINQLNSQFQQLNVSFDVCPVNYIDNSSFYNGLEYSLSSGSQEYQMAIPNRVPDAINIFFVPNALYNGTGVCGWSSFPFYEQQYNKDWTVMNNSCATNGSTLAHEVGHYFSLYHTHETAMGAENVTRNSGNGCYDCSTQGDLLCDTAADPRLSGLVNTSCNYTGNGTDDCNVTYVPDPDNLMSYSRKECRDIFSPGQQNRMLTSLANDRDNLAASCVGCEPDLVITQNVFGGESDLQEAENTITATNDIFSNGNAEYDAGVYVKMNPGFHAKAGSTFRAYIDGCTPGSPFAGPNGSLSEVSSEGSAIELAKSLVLYPNPTTDFVQLESDSTIAHWELTNQLGNIHLKKELNAKRKATIDLNTLTTGVYFLKVHFTDGETLYKTVIKE